MYLKQFMMIAVLRLLESLFQLLGPTYDELFIRNFDLRKGNFYFLLQQRVAAPLLSTEQKISLK